MVPARTDLVPMVWHPGTSEVPVMWSVMLGIEQAARGEGTFLTDEDLFLAAGEDTPRNLDDLFDGESPGTRP